VTNLPAVGVWAGPVAFLCLGLFLVFVRLLLWPRGPKPAETV
jgi:hypothetical protein